LQSSEDTIYEQDLLRDPGSIKPWLSYIEYKRQNGTLYEQSFVGIFLSKLVFITDSLPRLWSAPASNFRDLTNCGRW
jgi:hypothetical protein